MARHVIFEHDSAFYHQLLDMYLATAKNNPDSFLEFRIQANILCTKFTTTAWPNNNGFERNKPSFCNIQPYNGPNTYRQQPPPSKRRHAAIISPAPQQPSTAVHNSQKPTNSMPLNNNASVTDQVPHSPTPNTPEIVRGSNEYFYSDHLSVEGNEICSDFTTPNRFECLAKLTDSDQLHDDTISLENIDAKPPTPTLDITPPAGPKKTMESC